VKLDVFQVLHEITDDPAAFGLRWWTGPALCPTRRRSSAGATSTCSGWDSSTSRARHRRAGCGHDAGALIGRSARSRAREQAAVLQFPCRGAIRTRLSAPYSKGSISSKKNACFVGADSDVGWRFAALDVFGDVSTGGNRDLMQSLSLGALVRLQLTHRGNDILNIAAADRAL